MTAQTNSDERRAIRIKKKKQAMVDAKSNKVNENV